MPTSAPIVDVAPRVREAFDEACLAVFQTRVQHPLVGRAARDLLLRFSGRYQQLSALPRRTRRSLERRWKRTLSAIALLLTLAHAPAWAATIDVSPGTPPSINSDGRCSLSEAIINANANAAIHSDCAAGAGPDTIFLPPMSQQQLQGAATLPRVTSRIVIEGRDSTVSRNTYAYADFFIVRPSGDLTLNKTTVTGANATSFESRGYGVRNEGRLRLNDSSIADTGGLFNSGGVAGLTNSSVTGTRSRFGLYTGGNGIQNRGGTLVLTNSVVADNVAAELGGGGIYNSEGSSATLVDSIVSNNRARYGYEGPGGGILNRGSLTLVGSTVSDNEGATSGGGIYNSSTGTATIRRSTISDNFAYYPYSRYTRGGGIDNRGTLTLINSTVSNNVIFSRGQGYGGGVNSRGTLTILSSTVTGNMPGRPPYSASYFGGGVFVESGTLRLRRSIVSGNTAGTVREIGVAPGVVVTADDHNLFGHDGDSGIAGFTSGATDIVPDDPVGDILLPLADNGGGTQTHALAIGSPALDASPDDATCPAIDQRGNPRPQGPACDIGSFEGSAVLCAGRVTTMVGTNGRDHLTGTPGADVISGLSGNDAIVGLEGNDVICAGGGADRVYGGPGNDVLFGQLGDDRLFGYRGNDTLNGGAGQDECDGGSHTGAADTAAACETVSNVP
jgi:hypothetical protein